MKQRLRNIYKTGYPKIGEIILTSRNISDMLHRVKYFQELNTYDKMLMRSIDSTKAIINEHKIALETEQKQLTSLKTKKEKEKFEREHEQKSREIMLANIKSEKDAYISMVKELERAQEELNILVERLIRKRKKAKTEYEQGLEIAFEKRKSKLPWPIEGPVIRKFGKIVHPIYKTVTMSNGLDIKASEGEAVLCVAPGQIDYIGWMRGYGKFVIVNHFGGYLTIYGHMNRIDVATDQKVKYGTVLGIVGDTGSLNGVKLHFQIRKSTETLNPQDWLEKKE